MKVARSLIDEGCAPVDITFARIGGTVQHDVAQPDEGGTIKYTRPQFALRACFIALRICHEGNVLLVQVSLKG